MTTSICSFAMRPCENESRVKCEGCRWMSFAKEIVALAARYAVMTEPENRARVINELEGVAKKLNAMRKIIGGR